MCNLPTEHTWFGARRIESQFLACRSMFGHYSITDERWISMQGYGCSITRKKYPISEILIPCVGDHLMTTSQPSPKLVTLVKEFFRNPSLVEYFVGGCSSPKNSCLVFPRILQNFTWRHISTSDGSYTIHLWQV